jgi:hypothetical protein
MATPDDAFLIQLNEAIGLTTSGQILHPLIQLISEYARSYWLFSSTTFSKNQEGKCFLLYDPYTRKIIHTQDINNYQPEAEPWIMIRRSVDRALFLFAPTESSTNLVLYPVRCDLKRKETDKFKLIISPPMVQSSISHLLHYHSIVCTGHFLYVRDLLYYWHRFDLQTEKWDPDGIHDSRKSLSDSDNLRVTSISQCSFVGIEKSFLQNMLSTKFRCFCYDGEKTGKPIIFSIGEFEMYKPPMVVGHVRDENIDMVVAVFQGSMILIKIKTRVPSLSFHPPEIVKFQSHPLTQFNIWPWLTVFIDSSLWCYLANEHDNNDDAQSYQFSFGTFEWIPSTKVPKQLLSCTLLTVI